MKSSSPLEQPQLQTRRRAAEEADVSFWRRVDLAAAKSARLAIRPSHRPAPSRKKAVLWIHARCVMLNVELPVGETYLRTALDDTGRVVAGCGVAIDAAVPFKIPPCTSGSSVGARDGCDCSSCSLCFGFGGEAGVFVLADDDELGGGELMDRSSILPRATRRPSESQIWTFGPGETDPQFRNQTHTLLQGTPHRNPLMQGPICACKTYVRE